MARAAEGLAVRCSPEGRVLDVLSETLGLVRPPVVGANLSEVFPDDNTVKLVEMLREVSERGAAFDWSLNVETSRGVRTLHFTGVAVESDLLLTATWSSEDRDDIYGEFVAMNSELVNSVRELRQSSAAADVSIDELTRLYDSLVDLKQELTRKNDELENGRHFLESILETTPNIVYIFDLEESRFVYLNPVLARVVGVCPEEALSVDPRERVLDAEWLRPQGDEWAEVMGADDGQVVEREYRMRNAEGDVRLFAVREKVFVRDDDGNPRQVLGIAADITERERIEAELERHARTDSLTHAANRRGFLERATHERARAIRHGRPLALIAMDLDDLKRINNTHGHAVGDEALVLFAQVCRDNIRAIDMLARFGGDEFVILLPETDDNAARDVALRVQASLESVSFGPEGLHLRVASCAGIATLKSGHESLDQLLSRADAALDRAKDSGRACVEVAP